MALSMLFTAISALWLSLGIEVQAETHARALHEPIWRVDLRSLGYTGFRPKDDWGEVQWPYDPIGFPEARVCVATFLTHEGAKGLSRRGDAKSSFPFRLHAVSLDSTTGQVRAKREWPTSNSRAGVIAVEGGKFIVVTFERMGLYTVDLEVLKELPLPTVDRRDILGWSLFYSPTGKSLLFRYWARPTGFTQWIDAEDLNVVRVSQESFSGATSISDDEIAMPEGEYAPSQGVLDRVLVRPLDGPWRTLCSAGYLGGCGTPHFIGANTLILKTMHEVHLLRTSGERLFYHQFRGADEWLASHRPVRPAAEGRRFALRLDEPKGGSTLLDIMPRFECTRVMVFDVPSRQWIYTLEAKKEKIKKVSGIALSPDGSLLAILADGILRAYRLPEAPAETPDTQPAP